MSESNEWNGEIIDVWDKPVDPSQYSGKGVPIIDLWSTVDKTQPNGSKDTRKDEKKSPLWLRLVQIVVGRVR